MIDCLDQHNRVEIEDIEKHHRSNESDVQFCCELFAMENNRLEVRCRHCKRISQAI